MLYVLVNLPTPESVDKIVQGNTSNIVFLKSTDDSMLQQLETMSGKTHRAFRDSKTITKDLERLVMPNEGKITYTVSTKEMPVISYNDMAFISERNSIVFRAGDSPIWNRNETILPMSWRLFLNTITQPGKDYSLQTIPTLSSALDFDVRKNQPDFMKMWEKRKTQARYVQEVKTAYQKAYQYTDYQIAQMDPNVYAEEIMALVNQMIREKVADDNDVDVNDVDDDENEFLSSLYESNPDMLEDYTEVSDEVQTRSEKYTDKNKKRYAGNMMSRYDLFDGVNTKHSFDTYLIRAFRECRAAMLQDMHFADRGDGSLYSNDGILYIKKLDQSETLRTINQAVKDKSSRAFADGELTQDDLNELQDYQVMDAFLRFLAQQETWSFANGRFEEAMARIMNAD